MKHFLSIFSLFVISVVFTTSCLEQDEDGSQTTYHLNGMFTITGSHPSYTLYQDGGGRVIPTSASVAEITGGKGFEDNERAYFIMQFTDNDVSADGKTINNANLLVGSYIQCIDPLTTEQAVELDIANPDSINKINRVVAASAYRGYLNTQIMASYLTVGGNAISPAINLVYDENNTTDDIMRFTLYYNAHTKTPTVVSDALVHSFRLDKVFQYAPGRDTIDAIISSPGASDFKVRIARIDFQKGNYESK